MINNLFNIENIVISSGFSTDIFLGIDKTGFYEKCSEQLRQQTRIDYSLEVAVWKKATILLLARGNVLHRPLDSIAKTSHNSFQDSFQIISVEVKAEVRK
jgi:hypothetical protein